jgi:hypothetical protein
MQWQFGGGELNHARGLFGDSFSNPVVNQSTLNVIPDLGVPYMTVNIRQRNSTNLLTLLQAISANFFTILNIQLIISSYELPCKLTLRRYVVKTNLEKVDLVIYTTLWYYFTCVGVGMG